MMELELELELELVAFPFNATLFPFVFVPTKAAAFDSEALLVLVVEVYRKGEWIGAVNAEEL